LSSYALHPVA